jgi:hypothetical protein
MEMEVSKFGMPIVHYPILNHVAGSTSGGYMLSQSIYWWNKMGGEFYKSDASFAQELGMNPTEFRRAKKNLIDKQILIVKVKGVPRKSYYSLNEESLTSWCDALLLVGGMPTSKSEPTPPTIQRLPETTTEITRDGLDGLASQPTQTSSELPLFLGKTPLARLVEVYSLKFVELYGFKPTLNWGLLGKLFRQMQQDYSEWQIAAMILLHFDWHGASGDDDFTHNRLADRCFPLEWVPKTTNAYRAYLQNTLGVDFADQDVVRKHVTSLLKPLHQEYGRSN